MLGFSLAWRVSPGAHLLVCPQRADTWVLPYRPLGGQRPPTQNLSYQGGMSYRGALVRPEHRLEACATKGNGGLCPPSISRGGSGPPCAHPASAAARAWGTGLSGQIQGPVAEAQTPQERMEPAPHLRGQKGGPLVGGQLQAGPARRRHPQAQP